MVRPFSQYSMEKMDGHGHKIEQIQDIEKIKHTRVGKSRAQFMSSLESG